MKKTIALLLALIMCLSLFCGCGAKEETPAEKPAEAAPAAAAPAAAAPAAEAPAEEAPAEECYTIKLPTDYAETHFYTDLLKNFFATEVEKRSNGTLKVEVYPGNITGTQEQIYEGVCNGMYEMAIIGVICQDVMPIVGTLQYPFLFKDWDTAIDVLFDKGYGMKILEGCEEYGFKVMAFNPVGFRVMTLNQKIESLADFRNFKMRCPTIANMVAIFENLGCIATAMAMGEVYSALETGLVDGQENPPSTIRSSGWYEVQDYLLVSNHVFNPDFLAVNVDFYNKLSDNQRQILDEVSAEFHDKVVEAVKAANDADLQYMIDNSDIEVYYPSDEFKAEMVEATSVMYDEFYAQYPQYKDLIEEIRAFSK